LITLNGGKMKIKLLLLLCLIIISLPSCSSSDDNVQKSIIKDILQQISIAFSMRDLDTIFSFYHTNFKHNGNNLDAIIAVWQYRYNNYQRLELEIVDIRITGDMAKVSLKARFNNEPVIVDDNIIGDLTYFFYDIRDWKIVGNEFEY